MRHVVQLRLILVAPSQLLLKPLVRVDVQVQCPVCQQQHNPPICAPLEDIVFVRPVRLLLPCDCAFVLLDCSLVLVHFG